MKLVQSLLFACCFLFALTWPVMAQEPNNQNVTLNFKLNAGDKAATCNQKYTGFGSVPTTTVEFADLRYYVSNVRLINQAGQEIPLNLSQGSTWQYQNVALLDFEDKSGRCSEIGTTALNTTISGTVATGSYTGVIFNLGVPFALNHQDVTSATAPLNLPPLWWNWQGGYKFIRVDMYADSPITNSFWPIHLGSTGCSSANGSTPPAAPCTNPNLPEIRLNKFNFTHDVIVGNIATLLTNVNVSTSTSTPNGCMSGQTDPDCVKLFPNLGLSLQTGQCINGCADQKLFQVESPATKAYLPLIIRQTAADTTTLDLRFAMKVGDQTAACNQKYSNIGSAKSTVDFADLRFYVSNIRLINSTGNEIAAPLAAHGSWQYQNVALLDFENKTGRCNEIGTTETNNIVKLTLPQGQYTGIKFNLGVPFTLNHQNVTSATTPLNLPALWWNWQGGYKFVRFDVYNDLTLNNFWPIHLGSTGCASANSQTPPTAPCSNPNLPEITFSNFNATSQTIVADIATVLNGVDVSTSVPQPSGCMSSKSDPDCNNLFPNLGLSLETGQCINECKDQKLFRLE